MLSRDTSHEVHAQIFPGPAQKYALVFFVLLRVQIATVQLWNWKEARFDGNIAELTTLNRSKYVYIYVHIRPESTCYKSGYQTSLSCSALPGFARQGSCPRCGQSFSFPSWATLTHQQAGADSLRPTRRMINAVQPAVRMCVCVCVCACERGYFSDLWQQIKSPAEHSSGRRVRLPLAGLFAHSWWSECLAYLAHE